MPSNPRLSSCFQRFANGEFGREAETARQQIGNAGIERRTRERFRRRQQTVIGEQRFLPFLFLGLPDQILKMPELLLTLR